MCRRREHLGGNGFTIVEIMIVVTIIGILAVISIPAAARARQRSQNTAFANDLRQLSGTTLDFYAFEFGDFPPDAAPGIEPSGLASFLPQRFEWTKRTPIGGYWDWDRAVDRSSKVNGVYAAISVFQPQRTTAEMQEIDAAVDDGDLSTGLFRSRPDGYMYVLEF